MIILLVLGVSFLLGRRREAANAKLVVSALEREQSREQQQLMVAAHQGHNHPVFNKVKS